MTKKAKTILVLALALAPFAPVYKTSTNRSVASIPFLKKKANFKDLVTQLTFLNNAHAAANFTTHSINNLRMSMGLALGYSDNSAYGYLACGGTTPPASTDCADAPPYNGIVGRLTDIINTLPTIGNSAGITSCEAVPASGSATGIDDNGSSVTVHFASPTHTIPSPWQNGGATFQKRVEFTESILGSTTKIAYEFNCGDSPAAYVAINMAMGVNDGHTYTRRITVYNGQKNTNEKGIEVYMAEYSNDSRLRAADAIRIEYNSSSSEYNLWGIMNTNISGGQLVTRSVIHGNYTTGEASILYNGHLGNTLAGNDGAIDASQFPNSGFSASTNLTDSTGNAPDYDLATAITAIPTDVYKKGCINFTAPNTAPASNAECATLALTTAAAAPYVDATGSWNIYWTLTTMPTKLEVLP
jgi:hypothetical protein